MPSNHFTLCRPLLLLPSIFLSIRVFSNELVLHIRWPKYWSFSFSPSNEYSGLISFRIDWFDLLAFQGTQESSPTPQLKHQFFGTQPFLLSSSHICVITWKNHSFDCTDFCRQRMSLLFNVLSRFVITFIPRSKCLLISCLWSPSPVILEPN